MKQFLFSLLGCVALLFANAQNVGIGVVHPSKKLSVNGSIVVDHNNANNGSLDSAALLFGVNPIAAGISSDKNVNHADYGGLNFWTGQAKRLTILESGNIGINTFTPAYSLTLMGNFYVDNAAYFNASTRFASRIGIGGNWDNNYRLKVIDGNAHIEDKLHVGGVAPNNDQLYVQSPGIGTNAARFTGGNVIMDHGLTVGSKLTLGTDLSVGGYAFVGGIPDYTYRMRVYGNARVDDNFRVNAKFAAGGAVDDNYFARVYGSAKIDENLRVDTRASIGGAVDDNFKLRVYGGNSRFGGDVETTGTTNTADLAVTNTLTIGGKGSVKSNGVSPLKIHFTDVTVYNYFDNSGELSIYYVDLPDFDNPEDVRLSISHFVETLPNGFNPHNVATVFAELDPVQNRAVLILRSIAQQGFTMSGKYFITAIMKDN